MEISIICDVCGSNLEGWIDNREVVRLQPCDKCLKEAAVKGYEDSLQDEDDNVA